VFRECVEEYYRLEDRVRRNRGEKFGRRRTDNSRDGVRFMFALAYARVLTEALTGTAQTHFRHPPTERWLFERLGLPVLTLSEKTRLRKIRRGAREIIAEKI